MAAINHDKLDFNLYQQHNSDLAETFQFNTYEVLCNSKVMTGSDCRNTKKDKMDILKTMSLDLESLGIKKVISKHTTDI